jgi:aminopeptidase YwaD
LAGSIASTKSIYMQFRARIVSLLFLSFFVLQDCIPQKLKKADKLILANLENEIHYLASDQLEGRRTGSPGEKLASDYIIAEFQKIGLKPMGNHGGWLQSFEVNDGKQVSSATHFIINSTELQLEKDYFPLSYSAQKSVEGMPAIALQERGVPWFVDCREILEAGNDILISI